MLIQSYIIVSKWKFPPYMLIPTYTDIWYCRVAAVFCPLQIWKCTQILSLSLLLQLWGTPIAIPSSFNSCSSSTLKWSSFEAKLHAIANVFKWNLLLPRCEFFWIFANFLKNFVHSFSRTSKGCKRARHANHGLIFDHTLESHRRRTKSD